MNSILRIAHRGASGHAPENTLEAFEAAMRMGADMIELDVHQCKTGEIIVMHDETVDRTTDGHGTIRSLTLSQIKKLEVGSGQSVPTLAEVLEYTRNRCQLNIEVKRKQAAAAVLTLVRDAGRQHDVMISSNYISALQYISQKDNRITTALIYYAQRNSFCQSIFEAASRICFPLTKKIILSRAKRAGVTWINLSKIFARKKFVDILHARGYRVAVWTVNDAEKIARYRRRGVDGIMTNFPDRFDVIDTSGKN